MVEGEGLAVPAEWDDLAAEETGAAEGFGGCNRAQPHHRQGREDAQDTGGRAGDRRLGEGQLGGRIVGGGRAEGRGWSGGYCGDLYVYSVYAQAGEVLYGGCYFVM
ncbi:hypothetical protein GCM10009804_68020 [Kribbella hippodromi]|uniref:Uncharacterized protein n=1 Tax=Kribbella hippodromi TaxID=434347 RepID=A0ABN2EDM7_9ACTN